MAQVDHPTHPAGGPVLDNSLEARAELAQGLAILFRAHSFEDIQRLGAEGRLDELMPVADVAPGALVRLPDWGELEAHDGAAFDEKAFAAYLESLKT